MKAILSGPSLVNGDSNVRITLAAAYALTASDFVLTGNPPSVYRIFGSGKSWYFQYSVPEGVQSDFEITLSSAFRANTLRITCDTIRSVVVTFGTVRYEGERVIVPVSVDRVVVGLTKHNFRCVGFEGQCYLYGKDRSYELVAVPSGSSGEFRVETARQACKSTLLMCDLIATPLVVRYPEGA